MIRMCRNKKIDLVITKSISRFARNTVDCLEYVRQLKDLGIGVILKREHKHINYDIGIYDSSVWKFCSGRIRIHK